ncbi:hypothetical protein EVAR_94426_1 [Eumeta japonica]|uniref:Uncharacterized protein n=1 Tax=Eumeta variegata TaxID=151549 RepID=A0A4C1TQ60_EUMVA|nr:hypothetical protein EVAR_94426_1 [Eumeta japonica]
MKQRLLQQLVLSEWKGRVPFTFMSVSLALRRANHAEWKDACLSLAHCERITNGVAEAPLILNRKPLTEMQGAPAPGSALARGRRPETKMDENNHGPDARRSPLRFL